MDSIQFRLKTVFPFHWPVVCKSTSNRFIDFRIIFRNPQPLKILHILKYVYYESAACVFHFHHCHYIWVRKKIRKSGLHQQPACSSYHACLAYSTTWMERTFVCFLSPGCYQGKRPKTLIPIEQVDNSSKSSFNLASLYSCICISVIQDNFYFNFHTDWTRYMRNA